MVLSAYVLPQGCQLLFNSSSFGWGGEEASETCTCLCYLRSQGSDLRYGSQEPGGLNMPTREAAGHLSPFLLQL